MQGTVTPALRAWRGSKALTEDGISQHWRIVDGAERSESWYVCYNAIYDTKALGPAKFLQETVRWPRATGAASEIAEMSKMVGKQPEHDPTLLGISEQLLDGLVTLWCCDLDTTRAVRFVAY